MLPQRRYSLKVKVGVKAFLKGEPTACRHTAVWGLRDRVEKLAASW
jgi:hypothetical protein